MEVVERLDTGASFGGLFHKKRLNRCSRGASRLRDAQINSLGANQSAASGEIAFSTLKAI